MGSLTEEQLDQMVRDFIESETESQLESASLATSNSQNHKPRCPTLQKILWETTDIEVEVLQQISKHAKSVEFAGGSASASATHLKKLVVTKLKTNGYEASLCKTCWVSTFDRPKVFHCTGDYEYIDVMMRDKNGGKPTRLIVDMDFRSQFELAKPTRAYKELTDTLPCIFVGTEAKLSMIVSLFCSAAKESLKEKGLHIPPWRKASYMQSKWLSKDCNKIFAANKRDGPKVKY